jgi:hypothetical protein
MIIRSSAPMAQPDGVDGRHKAGHDGGGRSINGFRYKGQDTVSAFH